jgi:small subunit ribosomal protein S7
MFQLRRGEFDKEDPRNFLHSKPMLFNDSPVFYRDHIVDKMVNVCLRRGQKELAQQLIYEALEIVKRRQYKKHRLRKEDDEPVELDPFVIANKAIRNCRPLMKLLNVTRGRRLKSYCYRLDFQEASPTEFLSLFQRLKPNFVQ